MVNNIIEISNLTKRYGLFTAVDKLNLSLLPGEIFGLLGPNGAGKSTTILMLMGLTEPSEGSIRVDGIDPVRNPVDVKKIVGYLPEDVGFYDNLSGLENLVYTAGLNGMSKTMAIDNAVQMLGRVGLSDEMHKKTGKYSRGMRQRLGIADVLIKKPKIIILDEPTLGIDPAGIREFLNLIVKLSREEGITVLFSSHHLHQVQQVCDRVGIFVKGKLLAAGNLDYLAKQLFSSHAYIVEARIALPEDKGKSSAVETQSHTVIERLSQVEGVAKAAFQDDLYIIECTGDITPVIAKTIVDTGFGLTYLNVKKYGLDDIYYRYFEGGYEHDQHRLSNS
ncbi:MAG: ABC transporter ATP-binding protein [Bacteroidales bacterium]|nr:ABC transporter ATP-binding protein [Bacteroidales bacterium]